MLAMVFGQNAIAFVEEFADRQLNMGVIEGARKPATWPRNPELPEPWTITLFGFGALLLLIGQRRGSPESGRFFPGTFRIGFLRRHIALEV
jgi:hypothetical protein